MNSQTADPEQHPIKETGADPRLSLAVERTELALERTQLAWIRTVIGFIASGIALDKGMEIIHRSRVQSGKALFESTHVIGIILTIAGTLLMVITTWYYIHRARSLAKMKGAAPTLLPSGAIASLIIILLGIVVSLLLLFV